MDDVTYVSKPKRVEYDPGEEYRLYNLFQTLNTKLDTYSAEIYSVAVMDKLRKEDLHEAWTRVSRFQSDLEKILWNE